MAETLDFRWSVSGFVSDGGLMMCENLHHRLSLSA